MFRPRMGLDLCRDVGSGTAVALEGLALVFDAPSGEATDPGRAGCVAVGAPQVEGVAELGVDPQWTVAICRPVGREELVERLAQQSGCGDAGHLAEACREIGEAKLAICLPDPVRGRFRHVTKSRLAALQCAGIGLDGARRALHGDCRPSRIVKYKPGERSQADQRHREWREQKAEQLPAGPIRHPGQLAEALAVRCDQWQRCAGGYLVGAQDRYAGEQVVASDPIKELAGESLAEDEYRAFSRRRRFGRAGRRQDGGDRHDHDVSAGPQQTDGRLVGGARLPRLLHQRFQADADKGKCISLLGPAIEDRIDSAVARRYDKTHLVAKAL